MLSKFTSIYIHNTCRRNDSNEIFASTCTRARRPERFLPNVKSPLLSMGSIVTKLITINTVCLITPSAASLRPLFGLRVLCLRVKCCDSVRQTGRRAVCKEKADNYKLFTNNTTARRAQQKVNPLVPRAQKIKIRQFNF